MKLCDTSVLVDIDRTGDDDRINRLDDEGRHVISTVSVTELRLGVNKRYDTGRHKMDALDGLDRLLARFNVVDISRPVATAAANIIADLERRGRPLHDLHDVYIAATAQTEQLPVLTANVDHFQRIDDVTVVDWTEY
ncbi:type II toxin-antitoxin system VapC family toxin [Salinadaptatus halalkaliphilus]|uniref:Ribonuclease VapC n=1 Tax=Salinadaptatus halalkaliphilus TaxID=2419781 RepID=A0A4S3TL97_9EURY|nr:type II toxin-antitoxin system VapC family toxin [Salinadaptatus halalkaliphilus]THE64932.1 type II toxin-antitoxin system VapC family toxin [Salinadaptatus halalkaliphilus]